MGVVSTLLVVFPKAMNASTATLPASSADDALLAQHLELMMRQSKAVFGGNFAMAGLSLVALWNFTDHRVLLAWAAFIFALTGARMLFVSAYRRAQPPPAAAGRWSWLFAATSLLSGISWGTMALLFFDAEQPLSVLFVCWALAGMTTAAVPTLSNFLPAYVGFAVPAITPYIVLCFLEGGPVFNTLGVLTPFFLAANIIYARTSHRTIGESFRLRYENLALLQQLQVEKDRAEAANAAKTRFLAAASHDLRQPTHALGLFIGALERMLQRESAPSVATVAPVVGRMGTTLKGMGNLLNSLLDASRLEAGAVPVQHTPIRMQDIFERLHDQFHGEAEKKGLNLQLRPTRLVVRSDPVLLTRILSNLIANAIKYTPRGRVLVGCRRRGTLVEIQVHDTGVGIDPANHEAIFEEFVQLDNTARNREQGLGLGLSIVDRAARLLGHPLRLASARGAGAMFSVSVPVTKHYVAGGPEVSSTPARQQSGTIIVVDDDTSAREAIQDLLHVHGYDVIAAPGIAQVCERIRDRRITAVMIIADYRLGGDATGVDAIRVIQPLLAAPAPAIIITGDTSPDRIREASASGFPLLHKPLEPQVLLAILHGGNLAGWRLPKQEDGFMRT